MDETSERAPIAGESLSVVLPGHNVALELEDVITAWVEVLETLPQPYEIVFVNDGSTDDTAHRADQLALRYPTVKVHHHETTRGIGQALHTGITNAQYSMLFYATCDKQFQPGDITHFLEKINDVDVVTGYRIFRTVPWPIRATNFVYRWFVRAVFGIPLEATKCFFGPKGWGRRFLARWAFGIRVADPECPFRLFRRGVFERIPIQSSGRFAHMEIMAKANFLGCYMMEVPVTCIPQKNTNTPSDAPFRKEFGRVFKQPDFGPVEAPEFDDVFRVKEVEKDEPPENKATQAEAAQPESPNDPQTPLEL